MPGLSARSVLSPVVDFAWDVVEAPASEELNHLRFRPASQNVEVDNGAADKIFLVFAGAPSVVLPNPPTVVNFANPDFDAVLFACHDIFSCGSNPAKPGWGTLFPVGQVAF